jgi:hypothetical protein
MKCKHKYALIRKTRVLDHVKSLPRPKLTQDILMTSDSSDELHEYLDDLFLKPENQSTDDIEVVLTVAKYNGQKNHTSYRPGNGRRDPRS